MRNNNSKSIMAILAVFIIFLCSEIINLFLTSNLRILLNLIYPSIAFWMSLICILILEHKNFFDKKSFLKISIISLLFLWGGSFILSAMHSPVTAFMDDIPFRYQIFRIPSIALFKTGWLIILSFLFFSISKQNK